MLPPSFSARRSRPRFHEPSICITPCPPPDIRGDLLSAPELFSQPVVAQCLLKPHTVAEGPHVAEHTDGITDVLRECEETLRALARQGRLTDAALAAFIRLAHSVEQEMERRRGSDRRREVRSSSSTARKLDRRSEGGPGHARTSCLNA